MKKELSEICFNVEDTDDNFVGVKYNKGDIQIIFLLCYRLPDDNKERIESIKQLFKTIKLSHDKKIDYEDSGEHSPDASGLPIDSFQWIINDYLDNGIYIDNEKVYSQDSKGKINWKRTFKTKFLVNKKSLVYLNPIIEKNNNIKNIISEIHAYCIDKSTETLWFLYNKISKVGNVKKPNLTNYINVINEELVRSFDDRKKLLLHHMKRIIVSEIEANSKNDIRDYGIRHYEHVWEYIVNELYGTEDVKQYYPDATYHIKEVAEFDASKLRPDTIFRDEENNFYIIDSKYYKAGSVAQDRTRLKDILPNTDSIQKQITYGDFVLKNFKRKEHISDIYNAFVIPYNKEKNGFGINKNIENMGYATCNWKDITSIDEKYLKIQIVFIDTKYLIDAYFDKKVDKKLLISNIK